MIRATMSTRTRTSDAGSVACCLALAALVVAWLAAPDIPITDHGGSGCGQWTPAEVVRFREQLATYALVPLVVAVIGAAYWTGRRSTVVAALVTTAGVAAVLWEPANPAYVWLTLGGVLLSPVWFGALLWILWRGSRDAIAVLAGLAPPLLLLALVLATRTPWIWSC